MTKAENIRNQCMKILDKYGADYRGVTVERIDGTTYVVFKYYGGTNDTGDRNDDSWDEMFELDGVVDVGYGEGYGIEGKYEDSLLIELDDSIVESKTSNKKSLKEKVTIGNSLKIIERALLDLIHNDTIQEEFNLVFDDRGGIYDSVDDMFEVSVHNVLNKLLKEHTVAIIPF